jgi:DNA-binding response OmpR family regulator
MNLSRTERGLLDYLRANTGRILSREEMAANIWKLKFYPQSRTIDQTVANVRRKSGSRIVAHFGKGYEFRPWDTGG